MAVKVNDVIGVAGYIDSGTRVDLVVTIRRRDESISRTVVSNVQVLSAGTRYEQEKARFSPAQVATAVASLVASPPAVVTLLVTPTEAERIALAQAEGQIMLVLRNPLDTQATSTTGVGTAALLAGEAPPPAPVVNRPVQRRQPPPPAPPAPAVVAAVAPTPPKPYTVETIRAAKRTEEVVQETGEEQEVAR
jgi:pilus assembly protein CpaB